MKLIKFDKKEPKPILVCCGDCIYRKQLATTLAEGPQYICGLVEKFGFGSPIFKVDEDGNNTTELEKVWNTTDVFTEINKVLSVPNFGLDVFKHEMRFENVIDEFIETMFKCWANNPEIKHICIGFENNS